MYENDQYFFQMVYKTFESNAQSGFKTKLVNI